LPETVPRRRRMVTYETVPDFDLPEATMKALDDLVKATLDHGVTYHRIKAVLSIKLAHEALRREDGAYRKALDRLQINSGTMWQILNDQTFKRGLKR
jgi:hypothetical protein